MTANEIYALTGEDLRVQARVLEVKFASNAGDRTIQEKMISALGLSEDESSEEKTTTKLEKKKASKDMVTIIVATKEDDDQPVPVGLNGKVYRMVRGEEVTVPKGVVEILNNAKQRIRDKKTGQDREILSYPFQIVG